MNEDKFLEVAKKAALEAGKIIQKYSTSTYQKNIKHGDLSDFVTNADIESEKKIVEILSQNFPDHNIIAEENTRIEKGSKYTWAIDPIDGSISFAQGIPYYSVSIGLLEDMEPVLGVIFIVSFNQLFWAVKGQGAYLNGEKIQVSKINSLEGAVCSLDLGHRNKRQGLVDSYFTPLMNKIGYLYSFGSAVACQALVSKGVLDGYVNRAWIWDFLAGAVIVREAGGKVTDFEGQELDWTKERLEIVASNGLIHDAILEELKK